MIDNFICQTVASSGSDALISLANALNGFGKFKDAFTANGVVYYTLIDGDNKETGMGNFNPNNQTLERTRVFTVVSGTDYIKEPAKVEWAYQMVFGEALYDASQSVDFELHESEETELVIKILEFAGLLVKDIGLYQIANQIEGQTNQQEKA